MTVAMSDERCRMCGKMGKRCVASYPENLNVPGHCERCHWEALHAALGDGPGPILPPPWAQEVQQPSDWSQQPQFVTCYPVDNHK